KIDRKDARPDDVLNEIFDLFVTLDATDEQLDFPILYAAGLQGIANYELEDDGQDLAPLFDTIIDKIPPPKQEFNAPFKMLDSSIDRDNDVERIAIGRVEQGTIEVNQEIALLNRNGGQKEKARATKLFTFNGLQREPVEKAGAGDIFALAGYEEV